MGQMKDLSGQKFGYLFVIKPIGKAKDRHIIWQCSCICGKYTNVKSNDLQKGHTKSCGCMTSQMSRIANIKHGFRLYRRMPRIYKTWLNMKDRCLNPNNKHYHLYGGRGISVCNEWSDNFLIFYNWAVSNGYSDRLEIDCIDSNGNYEPSNCRFVTDLVQARNSRHCIYQSIYGEKLCLSEIAERYQLTEAAVYWRFHKQGKRNEQIVEGGPYEKKTIH